MLGTEVADGVEWDVVRSEWGADVMENRAAFVIGRLIRFFVAGMGEFRVRAVLPLPISWSWRRKVHHLPPRSR